jgi:hypothetical protein
MKKMKNLREKVMKEPKIKEKMKIKKRKEFLKQNSWDSALFFIFTLYLGFFPPIKSVFLVFSIMMGGMWIIFARIKTMRNARSICEFLRIHSSFTKKVLRCNEVVLIEAKIKTAGLTIASIGFIFLCFSLSFYIIEVGFKQGWMVLLTVLQNKIHYMSFLQKAVCALIASFILFLMIDRIKNIFRYFALICVFCAYSGLCNKAVEQVQQAFSRTMRKLAFMTLFFSMLVGVLINIHNIEDVLSRVTLLSFMLVYVFVFFFIFKEKFFYKEWDVVCENVHG